MKRDLIWIALATVTACNTPVPSLRIVPTGSSAQACPSTNCLEVPMACATIMSIRIIDPSDPSVPYLSQCSEVPQNRKKDLCSLATVDLMQMRPLPITDLEVQVAVYPRDALATDPNTGLPICPADVNYDATMGFPVEAPDAPALGGRTFYHPGDEEVLVTLGCTNLMALNEDACTETNNTIMTSTVLDFDTRIPGDVSALLADRLIVSVGEPHEFNGAFVLNPADVRQLDRTGTGPIPAWTTEVDLTDKSSVCVEVLEVQGDQATTSLTCSSDVTATDNQLDLAGYRIARTSLQQILTALQLPQFPTGGLTIGIVVDKLNVPMSGSVVTAPAGSVAYLSADRTRTVSGATSSNGIFVSLDAPYGTVFLTGTAQGTVSKLGGRVEGKVTIVVLQFEQPVSM